MKPAFAVIVVLLLCLALPAQTPPKSVTVPVTLDHNRNVIDVYLLLQDGSPKRVRAWVDTGNPDLMMSRRVAALFGSVDCDGQLCKATPPRDIVIGGMKIPVGVAEASAPAEDPADVMVPGMSPEIKLPANVLRNYDVVFDYANRQFTIGEPGSVPFKGKASKAQINEAGLVQVASQVDGERSHLGLDTGSSISLVAGELISRWHQAHPSWPFMTGAVGAANMWGTPQEAEVQVLRVPALQFGGVELANVAVAGLSTEEFRRLTERAGAATVGLLGGDAFRNYRVGIDYVHSMVYLDQVTAAASSDMDVVGLTLRPERDGRYTVIGVVNYEGKPSVPDVKPGDLLAGVDGAPATGATMGQVWSLLSGSPGQTRSLTLERDGKRFNVEARVRRFLAVESKPAAKTAHPQKH